MPGPRICGGRQRLPAATHRVADRCSDDHLMLKLERILQAFTKNHLNGTFRDSSRLEVSVNVFREMDRGRNWGNASDHLRLLPASRKTTVCREDGKAGPARLFQEVGELPKSRFRGKSTTQFSFDHRFWRETIDDEIIHTHKQDDKWYANTTWLPNGGRWLPGSTPREDAEHLLTYTNWQLSTGNHVDITPTEQFAVLMINDQIGKWCPKPDDSDAGKIGFLCEWSMPEIQ